MTINPIITQGMGDNQMLITQGYGPITIIIPVVEGTRGRRRRPEIQIIPYSVAIVLKGLGIIDEGTIVKDISGFHVIVEGKEEFALSPLYVIVLHKVVILLKELDIIIPYELNFFMESMVENPTVISEWKEAYVLNGHVLIETIMESIMLKIPDIVKLHKRSKMRKLSELIDLIGGMEGDE